MSKRPTKNPMQADAPIIDREAEVLEPVSGDGLMPTEENQALQPRFLFEQKAGITSLDVMEIAMMRMVGLLAPHIQVEPGALRTVVLSEAQFQALSPLAQRQMRLVPGEPVPAEPETVAEEPVKH